MGGGGVVGRRGRSGKWSRALSHRQKYQALNWDTQRETGLALGRLWQETRRSLSCLCSSRWLDGLVRSSQPVSLLVAICKSVTLDEGPHPIMPVTPLRGWIVCLCVFLMISPVGVHVHHSRAAPTVMHFPWYLSHHVPTSQKNPQFDVFSPKNSKLTVFLHSQHLLAPCAEADNNKFSNIFPLFYFSGRKPMKLWPLKNSRTAKVGGWIQFVFFFLLSVSSASLSLLVRFPTAVPTSLYPRILFFLSTQKMKRSKKRRCGSSRCSARSSRRTSWSWRRPSAGEGSSTWSLSMWRR